MTVTLVAPTGSFVGAGITCEFSSNAGSYDAVFATIQDVSGNNIVQGETDLAGASPPGTNVIVTPGILFAFPALPTATTATNGEAPGASVNLVVEFDLAGSPIDTHTFSFQYDPSTGIVQLLHLLVGSTASDLSLILQSVRATY